MITHLLPRCNRLAILRGSTRCWVCSLAVLAVLAAGCGEGRKTRAPDRAEAERFGQLSGLKEAPDRGLQEELARIVEEGSTPEQLSAATVAEKDNVAAVLAELFPRGKIASILAESGRIFPPKDFQFSPTRLQQAISFRTKYQSQCRRARDALCRPQCDLGIRFLAGFTADLSLVDVVRICARLEAFQAAEYLSYNDPAAAVEPLAHMLRLAQCLGPEKHAVARLEAALLRAEALRVLQALVEHAKVTPEQLAALFELVQAQLAAWPSDADAWVGERALGMHAYEMVRAGELLALLTAKEFAQWGEEGHRDELPALARQTVNQDELYYLQTMRKIIDGCRQPYYARSGVFQAMRGELYQKRNSADVPLVAGRLLLPEIEKGHIIQARDRACCEAWALALAQAARRALPPYKTNPLTGKDYEVTREGGRIVVRNVGTGEGGDDCVVMVPAK